MLRAIVAAFGASAILTASVQARERALAPVDEWQLTRSEETCVLQRRFSDPSGAPLRLDIEAFAPGRDFKFLLVGDALPLRDGLRRGVGVIKYRFKPDRGWREASAVTGYIDGEDALSFQSDFSTESEASRRAELARQGQPIVVYQPDAVRAAEVAQLALAYPSRDDTVLQLGSMGDPLSRMHACTRELVSAWGYDPALIEGQSSAPVLRNGQEIGERIQREMRAGSLGQNAPINFRLDVDAAGKVVGCTVQAPRRDTAVEALICRILTEHAVALPARDAAGNPLAAPLVSRVAFGISYTPGGLRLGRP